MSSRSIEVLSFDGCPNAELAIERARAALEETGVPANVAVVRVQDEDQAVRLRFLGSPTVRVDGNDVDPQAAERDDFGIQCRIYRVDGRLEGAPPVGWIVSALRGQCAPAEVSSTATSGCACDADDAP